MVNQESIMEIMTLFLSFPTIVFAFIVVVIWFVEAVKAAKKPSQDRTPMDWLIMGVALGFAGVVADNTLWAIGISIVFLRDVFIMEIALIVNILFRQLLCIASAYCHIRSYIEAKGETTTPRFWIMAVILGFVYTGLLIYLK